MFSTGPTKHDKLNAVIARYRGQLTDKQTKFLSDYYPRYKGSIGDREYKVLGELGYEGSLNDRWNAYMRDLGGKGRESLDVLYKTFYGAAGYHENDKDPQLVVDTVNEFYRKDGEGTKGPLEKATLFNHVVTHNSSTAGNATMVDSTGKIKWRPHNLLQYSEDLTSIKYVDFGSTGNVTFVDATTITFAGGGAANAANKTLDSTNLVGQQITGAIELSSQTHAGEKVQIRLNWRGGTQVYGDVYTLTTTPTFVYVTGTVPAGTTGVDLIVASPAAEQVDKTFTATKWHVYRSDLGGMADVPASERVLPDATTYVSTTSSARYLPRIGHHVYNGSQWVNEGLLHESGSRTNLLDYSNDFSTFSNKVQTTVTDEDAVGPDGNESASTAVPSTTSAEHYLQETLTSDTGTFTDSVYAKADGYDFVVIRPVHIGATEGATQTAVFDLSDGTVTSKPSDATAFIEDVGNGWYRCSLTYTISGTITGDFAFRIQVYSAANTATFAGDGTKGIAIYGAQREKASNPSSYIPTSGSTVTRAEDTLNIEHENLPWSSSAVSIAMEGRVTYTDSDVNSEFSFYDWFIDGSNYLRTYFQTNGGTGKITASQNDAGTFDGKSTGGSDFSPDVLVPYSFAVRHGSTFINMSADGESLVANTNPVNLPDASSTDIRIGKGAANDYIGTIRSFRIWANDIGDDGIIEASEPELQPTLSLSFDGTETSFIDFEWSE